jgi:hypothetical protein
LGVVTARALEGLLVGGRVERFEEQLRGLGVEHPARPPKAHDAAGVLDLGGGESHAGIEASAAQARKQCGNTSYGGACKAPRPSMKGPPVGT